MRGRWEGHQREKNCHVGPLQLTNIDKEDPEQKHQESSRWGYRVGLVTLSTSAQLHDQKPHHGIPDRGNHWGHKTGVYWRGEDLGMKPPHLEAAYPLPVKPWTDGVGYGHQEKIS